MKLLAGYGAMAAGFGGPASSFPLGNLPEITAAMLKQSSAPPSPATGVVVTSSPPPFSATNLNVRPNNASFVMHPSINGDYAGGASCWT